MVVFLVGVGVTWYGDWVVERNKWLWNTVVGYCYVQLAYSQNGICFLWGHFFPAAGFPKKNRCVRSNFCLQQSLCFRMFHCGQFPTPFISTSPINSNQKHAHLRITVHASEIRPFGDVFRRSLIFNRKTFNSTSISSTGEFENFRNQTSHQGVRDPLPSNPPLSYHQIPKKWSSIHHPRKKKKHHHHHKNQVVTGDCHP